MNRLFNSFKFFIVQCPKLNCNENVSYRLYSVTPIANHFNREKPESTDITNPLVRYHFSHPERVKQFIRARDGYKVCNYIDSERYKKKIQEEVELQTKIVFEKMPKDIPIKDIKFEHVLDCAQPVPKIRTRKTKVKKHDVFEVLPPPQKVKPKKKKKKVPESVMSTILKKKLEEDVVKVRPRQRKTSILPVVLAEAKKRQLKKKQFRKRTTVLPIILKQTNERMLNDTLKDEETVTNCVSNGGNSK